LAAPVPDDALPEDDADALIFEPGAVPDADVDPLRVAVPVAPDDFIMGWSRLLEWDAFGADRDLAPAVVVFAMQLPPPVGIDAAGRSQRPSAAPLPPFCATTRTGKRPKRCQSARSASPARRS
jgi:hypothetical protein